MFKRALEEEVLELSRTYPIVSILGPRQSGKTTLVQALFPKKPYVNLEEPDSREFAQVDPKGFLASYENTGAIFDEIQRVPKLLSYIQVLVDKKQQKGFFILTGSHQLELHEAISQSLAGRTALVKLLSMSLYELNQAFINLSLEEYLLFGGFPRIFKDNINPTKAYSYYFQTYIERDVRQIINVKDLTQFQRFIKICAGRIGQILQYESLANDVGVSSHTIKSWLSILEASFIIFRLEPYFENFGKRLIKSPKLYFTDVGLLTYLLGIENINQLSRDPLRGNLIENLVLLELLKFRLNKGLEPKLYFFRDAYGHEVDAIFQKGFELVAFEIKSSQTFNKDFLKNLEFFKAIAKERFLNGFLIYTGTKEHQINSFQVLNYLNAINALI